MINGTQTPIQLLIEKEWAVDSIVTLGSGYLFHLMYTEEQVQPELLADLRSNRVSVGYPLEILHNKADRYFRVALAELSGFYDYHHFIRVDFRILQVPPYLRDGNPKNGWNYFCRYRP